MLSVDVQIEKSVDDEQRQAETTYSTDVPDKNKKNKMKTKTKKDGMNERNRK